MIVASYYIEGYHGLPLEINVIQLQLQCVVKDIKSRNGDNEINKMSSLKYCHKLIKRVNERDNWHRTQTRNICTGLVKVSILSNNRTIQSDTRLAHIMF